VGTRRPKSGYETTEKWVRDDRKVGTTLVKQLALKALISKGFSTSPIFRVSYCK
jgi:hypothetical protein